MDPPRRVAALLESVGIKKGSLKDRLKAAILQLMESADQPAPDLEDGVPAVAV
jgi:hypothetical protein